MSLDPINQFRSIYETFGLEFTPKSKTKILQSSSADNPVEQEVGQEFIRNSKENINNWKNRLSRDEINLIKENTSEISSLFYSKNEW